MEKVYGIEYAKNQREDIFMRAFLRDVCLRDSCYKCSFRKTHRLSDITLADYWGIENRLPEMDDDKGTSLVLINSEKGTELMEKIKPDLVFKEVTLDDAIVSNKALIKSPEVNKYREKFFKKLDNDNFENLVMKCTPKPSIIKRCILKGKKCIKRVI